MKVLWYEKLKSCEKKQTKQPKNMKTKWKLVGMQKNNNKATTRKATKRIPAEKIYTFQIIIHLLVSLMSVYIQKISESETNQFGKYGRLQNIGSDSPSAFSGISAQI